MVDFVLFPGGLDAEALKTWLGDRKIEASLLSAVGGSPDWLEGFFSEDIYFLNLDQQTPVPFINRYETPETLGRDRIAAVAGVQATFPGQPALVIDAGTCITFDAVSEEGVYLGGIISPGLEMRFKSLQAFTHGLPLIERAENHELEGGSTEAAIRSGVMNGMMEEISGLVGRYQKKYPGLVVAGTGGDYEILVKALKNTIFADPYLVLQGLNVILNYNRKQ